MISHEPMQRTQPSMNGRFQIDYGCATALEQFGDRRYEPVIGWHGQATAMPHCGRRHVGTRTCQCPPIASLGIPPTGTTGKLLLAHATLTLSCDKALGRPWSFPADSRFGSLCRTVWLETQRRTRSAYDDHEKTWVHCFAGNMFGTA